MEIGGLDLEDGFDGDPFRRVVVEAIFKTS
jgi:hypothetical protein